ncbi:PREDICTED: probable thiol methyltransferase 2 [Tarenaya hassleriana]|uniref:probable thiol methyltransferase 2 n=1 Tax=Tarenaya hassleriana TaxID=28532 RepID=UPI00053C322D|nr:PREDICTED: probable thiol methyltransferase 2 [Tarenaya hassleriana]
MFSSLPNEKYFSFIKEDFFTWQQSEQFDLIFDSNFFCAIKPHMRPMWARRMKELLKPDGELITLMFMADGQAGGPPYKVSASDYRAVLIPLGFEAVSIVDNELALEPRKGLEKLGRWKIRMGFES